MKKIVIIYLFFVSLQTFGQSKKELNESIEKFKSEQNSLKVQLSKLEEEIKSLKSENTKLESENTKLNSENAKIENELNKCVNGSINLLKKAGDFRRDEKYEDAVKIYEEIIQSYSTSNEAIAAEQNIKEISKILGEKEKEELKKASKKNLSIKHDEFKELTFYEDVRANKYHYGDIDHVSDPKTKLSLYFSVPDNSKKAEALRFKIGFSDDDWLFVENVTFLVDSKQYEVTEDFQRDNSGGAVYEWIDVPVDYSTHQILKSLMNGKSIKVRFTGSQYYDDALINTEQIEAIKSIYDLYLEMGGKI